MLKYTEGPHAFVSEIAVIFHYMHGDNICDRLEWIFDGKKTKLDWESCYSLYTMADSLKSSKITLNEFIKLLSKRDLMDTAISNAKMTLNKFFDYYARELSCEN